LRPGSTASKHAVSGWPKLCEIWLKENKIISNNSKAGEDYGVPGMIGATRTFGNLTHWRPHVHAIVCDGVLRKNGDFMPVPELDLNRYVTL
jgi:hypothetical protein